MCVLLTGEGQFGEVWKATAAGIVPDDISRNIVAIKTIKGWVNNNLFVY